MPREKVDVDELLRKKSDAETAASEANAALDRHHAEVAAERERREAEFDRGVAAEHDDRNRALLAEEQAARRAFEAAVIASPMIDAWITQRAARWSRVALIDEATSAHSRLGHDARLAPLDARDPRLLEEVLRVAENEAKRRGMDRIHTEVTEARDAHVNGEDQP